MLINQGLDFKASLTDESPSQWLEPKQGNRIGWKLRPVDGKELLSEYIDAIFETVRWEARI